MNNNKTKIIAVSALMAALVFLSIVFFAIPVPFGIIHLGDVFIYIAACLLPAPLRLLTGSVGAGMANLTLGLTLYMPATIMIKPLNALCFSSKTDKIICKRNIAGLLPATFITPVCYGLYEILVAGNYAWVQAAVGNFTQSISSAVLFVVVGIALDKIGVKGMIEKRYGTG
jgi:uncharacterized repeat protein (TIGR04002 family)